MDAWETLALAGLPIGAVRAPGVRVCAEDLRAALIEIARAPDALEPARRDALAAWLAALEHHWPSRFQQVAGDVGRPLREALGRTPSDPNRFLKLRRIAIENLASLTLVA